MIIKKILFAGLILLLGCATLRQDSTTATRKPIQFESVESTKITETNTSNAALIFGIPDETRLTDDGSVIWTYNEIQNGEPLFRLALQFYQDTGALHFVTWMPREGERLSSRNAALTYFRDAKFSTKVEGMLHSDDVVDQDRSKGITIQSAGNPKSVMFISFFKPEATTRTPSSNP